MEIQFDFVHVSLNYIVGSSILLQEDNLNEQSKRVGLEKFTPSDKGVART